MLPTNPGVVRSTMRKSFFNNTATAYGSCTALAYGEAHSVQNATIGCSISSTVADLPPRSTVMAGSTPESSSGIPPENTSSSSPSCPCFHSTCPMERHFSRGPRRPSSGLRCCAERPESLLCGAQRCVGSVGFFVAHMHNDPSANAHMNCRPSQCQLIARNG